MSVAILAQAKPDHPMRWPYITSNVSTICRRLAGAFRFICVRSSGLAPSAGELLAVEQKSLKTNGKWFGHTIKRTECYGYVYLWYDRQRRKLCLGSHHRQAGRVSAFHDGHLTSTGHLSSGHPQAAMGFPLPGSCLQFGQHRHFANAQE